MNNSKILTIKIGKFPGYYFHMNLNIQGDFQICISVPLSDDEFFRDTVDTPKDGIEQHKKREGLKSVISNSKAYLLGRKWTQEKVGKASDETINKTYAEYKQRELKEKGDKTGKALGKHAINLYSIGISRLVKIRDVKKL